MNYLELLRAEAQFNMAPQPILARHFFIDPDVLVIRKIIRVVCKYNDYSVKRVCGHSKTKYIAFSRHMISYIANHLYGISSVKIGRALKKDHTSVLIGRNIIAKLLTHDVSCARDLRDIRGML